jgi:hypothetical protein
MFGLLLQSHKYYAYLKTSSIFGNLGLLALELFEKKNNFVLTFFVNSFRNNEFDEVKRACKVIKVDDVTSTTVKARNCSWEKSCQSSCRKESPDTLTSCCGQSPHTLATRSTPSIDLDNHVCNFLQNDVIRYPQNELILYPSFHQPLYSYHEDVNQPLDIPQFEIPDISTQYPGLIQPQCTYGELIEGDQSYCYEDFTSPVQYTDWDTVYY